jgi:hypothetical protein
MNCIADARAEEIRSVWLTLIRVEKIYIINLNLPLERWKRHMKLISIIHKSRFQSMLCTSNIPPRVYMMLACPTMKIEMK